MYISNTHYFDPSKLEEDRCILDMKRAKLFCTEAATHSLAKLFLDVSTSCSHLEVSNILYPEVVKCS